MFSIQGALLYAPLLHHKVNNGGAGSDTQIALGVSLEIAVGHHRHRHGRRGLPAGKRQSQSMSLGYVAARTLESTVTSSGS